MTDINSYVIAGFLDVVVKPNAPKTSIVGWDSNKKMLRIAVAAVPDKDKANKELVRFVSKLTGKKVSLVKGSKSREKRLKLE